MQARVEVKDCSTRDLRTLFSFRLSKNRRGEVSVVVRDRGCQFLEAIEPEHHALVYTLAGGASPVQVLRLLLEDDAIPGGAIPRLVQFLLNEVDEGRRDPGLIRSMVLTQPVGPGPEHYTRPEAWGLTKDQADEVAMRLHRLSKTQHEQADYRPNEMLPEDYYVL